MNFDQHPRLLELRRRVQADPASIAFAQLAEEYRRAGNNEEAAAIARAGLQHHPNYLSARVTLGRALNDLAQLEDAERELKIVVTSAPDNLAANRALAEVCQKRGQLPEALVFYRKALELARFDPDLANEVQRIENFVAASAAATTNADPPAPKDPVEDLFDFDRLLEQLGAAPSAAKGDPPAAPIVQMAPEPLAAPALPPDDRDPFSVLERQLRGVEEHRIAKAPPTDEELHEQRLIDDLEDWLSAIVTDRDNHPAA